MTYIYDNLDRDSSKSVEKPNEKSLQVTYIGDQAEREDSMSEERNNEKSLQVTYIDDVEDGESKHLSHDNSLHITRVANNEQSEDRDLAQQTMITQIYKKKKETREAHEHLQLTMMTEGNQMGDFSDLSSILDVYVYQNGATVKSYNSTMRSGQNRIIDDFSSARDLSFFKDALREIKKTEESKSEIDLNLTQSQKSNNSQILQNLTDNSQSPIGDSYSNNITTEIQSKPPKAQLSGRINPKVMKKKSQNASNQQSFSKPGNKQFSKYTRSRQSEFSKDTNGVRINR